MYKKLTQIETKNTIHTEQSENCGLQLEGIFLKISKRFKSSLLNM